MSAPSPVVSNTSPLVNLAVIGRLDLMREQFRKVVIPQTVWHEAEALPHEAGLRSLRDAVSAGWLVVVPDPPDDLLSDILATGLDAGESAAIALAIFIKAELLLIDERKGRQEAKSRELILTGVLGILAAACRMGSVSDMTEEMRRLREEAGFFLSPNLEQIAISMAKTP